MKLKHLFLVVSLSCLWITQANAQFWRRDNRMSFGEMIRDVRIDVSTGLMTEALADISLYNKAKRNYSLTVGIDPRVDNKYKTGWVYGTVFQYIELEPSSPLYYFSETNQAGNPSFYSVEYGNMHIINIGLYYGYEMLLNKGFILTPKISFNETITGYQINVSDIDNPNSISEYYGGGHYFDASLGFETRLKLTPGFGLMLDYQYHYLIETAPNGQVTGGLSLKYYDMNVGFYFNLGPDTW